MSEFQKIIKYFAIALAMFLIFSIISGISFGLSLVGNIFDGNDSEVLEDVLELVEIEDNINVLDVSVTSSNILIKVGDTFKIDTDNKYIDCKQDGKKVKVTEKKHSLFNSDNSKLVIYIPSDMTLDDVEIDSGAGKIDVDKLSVRNLNLNLGAGSVNIDNLMVFNSASIDGGAGETVIKNSDINNLELDMGVGRFSITATILGNSDIDHGVGEAIINLLGDAVEYQINVSKGLGSVSVDGKNINNNSIIGNGMNKIDLDCGVGSVVVNFLR